MTKTILKLSAERVKLAITNYIINFNELKFWY